MRFLGSAVLLGLIALGSIADARAAATIKLHKEDKRNVDIYTQWVTEYVTVNDCSPPSTTVTVCDVCTPCVITAWTQCITSTTTSTLPTSTYCAQPGYYKECDCTIDYPQWIYYDTGCNVEYICPYQDWYYLQTKVVQVVVKVNNIPCSTIQQQWSIIVVPTPVVTYIVNPTIVVINDITINVTQAPTYITYTTNVTKTETTTITATAYPSASPTGNVNPDGRSMGSSSIPSVVPSASGSVASSAPYSVAPSSPGSVAPSAAPSAAPSTGPSGGAPVSTFKLLTTIDGTNAIIMQQAGSLVLTPATNSSIGVAFTLLSSGDMMTADGQYVSLTFTSGVAGEFTYGPQLSKRELMKRAIADGTYYGVFSTDGAFGMTIDGEAVTIQVCGNANVLSGGVGVMSGCTGITVESESIDTTPSSSSTAPASTATTAPPTSNTSLPTSTPESAAPTTTDTSVTTITGGSEATTTGNSEPTTTGVSTPPTTTGGSEPSTTTGASVATTTGNSEPTTTGGSTAPTTTGGSEPGTTTGAPTTTTTGNSEPTTTGGSNPSTTTRGSEPSTTTSGSEPTTTGPLFPNGTTNGTVAKRLRMARRMKFDYH